MAIYGIGTNATKLSDLQVDIQKHLHDERLDLHETWKKNDAYYVCFTNEEGTRYFQAVRVSLAGQYSKFGGGSYWKVRYGKILWDCKPAPMGELKEYFWTMSNKIFNKSSNGTVIPTRVDTKKEVLEIAKSIGTLMM